MWKKYRIDDSDAIIKEFVGYLRVRDNEIIF